MRDEIKKIILQKVISVCRGMADSLPDDAEKYGVFPSSGFLTPSSIFAFYQLVCSLPYFFD
jgi:hypothetical protein